MPSSALPHSLRPVATEPSPSVREPFRPRPADLPPRTASRLAAGRQNIRPVLAIAGHDPKAWAEPDYAHGARPARMPLSVFTAIHAFLSVAQDAFWVRMRAPAPQPRMQGGVAMAPWRERANIANTRGDAFGSSFVLDPTGLGMTSDVFANTPGVR